MSQSLEVRIEQIGPSTAKGIVRTHSVLIDRPVAKGGEDRGPLGGEYLLLALGALPAITRAIPRGKAARRRRITVNGAIEGSPDRFTSLTLKIAATHRRGADEEARDDCRNRPRLNTLDRRAVSSDDGSRVVSAHFSVKVVDRRGPRLAYHPVPGLTAIAWHLTACWSGEHQSSDRATLTSPTVRRPARHLDAPCPGSASLAACVYSGRTSFTSTGSGRRCRRI